MDCDALRDDQWERLKGLVPGGTKGSAGLARITVVPGCIVVDGALRRPLARFARTVRQPSFGEAALLSLDRDGRSRHHARGTVARSRSGVADDRLDHRAGASACRRRAQAKRGADAQGLGRSRGGLSTKIHAAGDALGNPIRLIGSPGQRNDIAFAHDLVDGFDAGVTIADKGYDADHLIERIVQTGTTAVIPPKRNRKVQRPYDADSTRSATSSSASSTSSNSSVASPPDTTSCSSTSWASLNRCYRHLA